MEISSHLVVDRVELCQQNTVDQTRIRALREGTKCANACSGTSTTASTANRRTYRLSRKPHMACGVDQCLVELLELIDGIVADQGFSNE